MVPNLLFVDDDERILGGLKRMLRSRRAEWNCYFANGGKAALELLKKHDYAVVVSDMRMPEMSGAELLDEVRRTYPGTIRIVLSGFADEDSILKTILSAHQYLAKPCDKSVLEETVKQALLLSTILDKSTAACVIGGMNCLPTLPSVVAELLEETENSKPSIQNLSRIISSDIALTAQTLRLTNSAYFGFPDEVYTPDEAIKFLGVDTFRSIVQTEGIFEEFSISENGDQRIASLNDNCMSILAIVEKICLIEGLDDRTTEIARSSAALSHIGSLIFMTQFSEMYDDLSEQLDETVLSVIEGEMRAFNVSHPALGAYLLGTWGFPLAIVEAVAFHHAPSKSTSFELGPLSILHASQCLARSDFNLESMDTIDASVLDLDYMDQAGLMDRLPIWYEAAKTL